MATPSSPPPVPAPHNAKTESLLPDHCGEGEALTTDQGVRISDNQNSLRAGARGPTLLEDFILREKITHFDHERIPERVVHARGEGAHGHFQVYAPQSELSCAAFLQDPAERTPVFVRFSTVAGSRGSADTVRDVRGFAVKFYTREGVFDLVGNNIPVFFIQDAIKFPDLIHAVKPEPHHEMPQAASAHDTFWDFVSLMPESTHMLMWVMSDRAIPRSLRMMEGFGVHTFRLVDAAGRARFVKFHWKPLLGMHALVWDEAQAIAGRDADFHRRDLWEAIEQGDFPEWELGVQVVEEDEAEQLGFDLLDATKLIPENRVPVRRIGKLTLDRNPDNFFAETEQVAFHPGHIVPGIDFSADPLLQGRLFSYLDTQLSRLGGPNFHEIPINRPICPFHNNQRDGIARHGIVAGRVAYEPNSLAGGLPREVPAADGGFVSVPEPLASPKIRVRSASFGEHFAQARLFWLSQSAVEQDHIVAAFSFELGKVETVAIRERMVATLARVDADLAGRVAGNLGLPAPSGVDEVDCPLPPSPELSMMGSGDGSIRTRKIAFLVADGVDGDEVAALRAQLEGAGARVKLIAPRLGKVTAAAGPALPVDATFALMPSVTFDAVCVPGGEASLDALCAEGQAVRYLREAYRHFKTVAATGQGLRLLDAAGIPCTGPAGAPPGVVCQAGGATLEQVGEDFIAAIAQHRHWQRAELPASC
ncbi:catalase HPII [Chitinimonas koreensis]|uniref:catalase HPII n=1 Tax=Chitinimonas koreensis TaxID=356302 RepID=UPI00041AA076|nr:catalase HPII [Chitinimonas koreensis]QNM98110.1 catalase HPII [Chitinimonas koreensis]